MAHRVVVMYAGKVVERAPVTGLFERPQHPYTAGLFHSLPKLEGGGDELRPIEGTVPDALQFPSGCRFHPRCPFVMDACRRKEPPLVVRPPEEAHLSACWYMDERPHAKLLGEFDVSRRAGAARPPEDQT
jgi:oligopeptide/dipeptide ABC transporter ATP-binding protein